MKANLWKARFIVGVIMILLGFTGIIVTNLQKTGGWDYWKWMVPIYGILALWLSWYVKRDTESIHPITIWHELGHWAGLIGAIFLTSDFGILGTVSRFNIGIFDLILVSYALFL